MSVVQYRNETLEARLARATDEQIQDALRAAVRETTPSGRVCAYFELAPAGKFRPSSVARMLDVSPSTVRRVCRTHFGMKPEKYLGNGWWFHRGGRS